VTSLQPCIPLIPAFEYVAACDLDAGRAARALRFGARRWYQDVRKMLREEALDAVIVVGPGPMNHDVGLACAEAGLHVFVEKPPAPTVEGARELAEAVRVRGTVGMTGTMWRHAPAVRMQRRVMEGSAFGAAVALQGLHIAPGYHVGGPGGAGATSVAWRFMLDQGCHMADCVQYLMGPARSVAAARSAATGCEDRVAIAALVTFETGTVGTIVFASHAQVMSPTVTVIGAAGLAATVRNLTALQVYPLPDEPGTAPLRAQVGRTWEHGANYRGISRPGYLEELEHFACAITAGVPAEPSLDDGWRALALCDAILASADGGAPVALGEPR
jgi:predicted dehydrogenase